MEINFNDANTGGVSGDNTLTSQEIYDYIQSENTGWSDSQIRESMENLTINVDKNADAVTFDLDNQINGSAIDFDNLTINDADGAATDFDIFVADSEGLIVKTNTVGTANADGTGDQGTVSLTDSDAASLVFASNSLTVTLDNTGWDAAGTNDDGQYQLTYNITNDVDLNGAGVVEGFGNQININGDLAFAQSDTTTNADGVINIAINVDDTSDADDVNDININYGVNITDEVDWTAADSGNLAAGVEVHVAQTGAVYDTTGNVSVDTNSQIGQEFTTEAAYGAQILNWLQDDNGAVREDAEMIWKADGSFDTDIRLDSAAINRIADAMVAGDARVDLDGDGTLDIDISQIVSSIKAGNIAVKEQVQKHH